jgi:hypothetical protein
MVKLTIEGLMTTIKSNPIKIFGFVLGLLSPIVWVMILVAVFIIFDTFFGLYTSHKLKVKFTSRKFSRFITKMLVYQGVIMTGYAIDHLLLGPFLLLFISIPLVVTKVIALTLIVAELVSIEEKLRMINDNKGIIFHLKRLLGLAKSIKTEVNELNDN